MPFPLLLLAGLLGGCQSAPLAQTDAAPALFRELGFADACTLATAENKPLFLYFDGDWAEESQRLLTEILPQRETATLISQRTIALHLDVVSVPDLTRRYHVKDVPLILLIGADGGEIDRWNGFANSADCQSELTAALAGETSVQRLRARVKPDDLKGRFKLGAKLVATGSYDEALVEFTSLYANPKLKQFTSHWAVSKTKVVKALGEIHKTYPPAAATLNSWRQQYESRVLADPNDWKSALQVRDIDRALAADGHFIDFFQRLPSDSRACRRLKRDAFKLLVSRRSYTEAAVLMNDEEALDALHKEISMPLLARGMIRILIPFKAGRVIKSVHLATLRNRLVYFEAYAGAGNQPVARHLAERIMVEDESGQAVAGLRASAAKARGADAGKFLHALGIPALISIPASQ